MITGRQIRAARGLLGWDAAALAEKAGLTRVTVSRIETDSVQAQEQSMSRILRALVEGGVEFTEGSGVRLKQQGVEVLEGVVGFQGFYSSIFSYLSTHGGIVIQSGVSERLIVKYLGGYARTYLDQMAALAKQRDDVRFQILVEEGDTNFVAAAYAEYRWQPKKYFSPSPFFVFADRLVLISFSHEPTPVVFSIKSSSLAEAYRCSFSYAWANAKIPPAFKKQSKRRLE